MAMANRHLGLSILCFVLPLSFFSNSGGVLKAVNGHEYGQGTWCIPKPSSTDVALKENIAYACNFVDCSLIQPGGSCFVPNNLMNHASVVMNSYYQLAGRNPWNCDFSKSGILTVSDPSYGNCNFKFKA